MPDIGDFQKAAVEMDLKPDRVLRLKSSVFRMTLPVGMT